MSEGRTTGLVALCVRRVRVSFQASLEAVMGCRRPRARLDLGRLPAAASLGVDSGDIAGLGALTA